MTATAPLRPATVRSLRTVLRPQKEGKGRSGLIRPHSATQPRPKAAAPDAECLSARSQSTPGVVHMPRADFSRRAPPSSEVWLLGVPCAFVWPRVVEGYGALPPHRQHRKYVRDMARPPQSCTGMTDRSPDGAVRAPCTHGCCGWGYEGLDTLTQGTELQNVYSFLHPFPRGVGQGGGGGSRAAMKMDIMASAYLCHRGGTPPFPERR